MPFENRTTWNPIFKKSGFQIVGFQIPTILLNLSYDLLIILEKVHFGWNLTEVPGVLTKSFEDYEDYFYLGSNFK